MDLTRDSHLLNFPVEIRLEIIAYICISLPDPLDVSK